MIILITLMTIILFLSIYFVLDIKLKRIQKIMDGDNFNDKIIDIKKSIDKVETIINNIK